MIGLLVILLILYALAVFIEKRAEKKSDDRQKSGERPKAHKRSP